jgi:hypothetical protein
MRFHLGREEHGFDEMVQNFVANPPFCKVIFLTCRWIEYRYNVELSVLLDRRHLVLIFEVNPCTTFPVAMMLMNLRAFYLTALNGPTF